MSKTYIIKYHNGSGERKTVERDAENRDEALDNFKIKMKIATLITCKEKKV